MIPQDMKEQEGDISKQVMLFKKTKNVPDQGTFPLS